MKRRFTQETRERMAEAVQGKIVARLEFSEAKPGDPGPSYWVLSFSDGSEFAFRFMSELIDE